MLVNDVSLRNLIPGELAKGFGFFQSKPSSAFSPVAVTPDELGDAWRDGKLHLPLLSTLNGELFGKPDAGVDMTFDFGQLVAHAAKTRPLGAGCIIGSGTVSNKLNDGPGKPIADGGVGYSCIAEIRTIETINNGKPTTSFMKFGDRIRIEMNDASGASIFGTIDQVVEEVQRPIAISMSLRLYSYWRSSAAYRVRIALNLKGLDHEIVPVSLAPGRFRTSWRRISRKEPANARAVPRGWRHWYCAVDGDSRVPRGDLPGCALLPQRNPLRSRVRAFCNLIACDIHPLNNLRVMNYIKTEFGADPTGDWYAHWIHEGFAAAEALASDGPYVFGNAVTLADALLVPQVYNARRFDVPLEAFPKLTAIVETCNERTAFQDAAPEAQSDAG